MYTFPPDAIHMQRILYSTHRLLYRTKVNCKLCGKMCENIPKYQCLWVIFFLPFSIVHIRKNQYYQKKQGIMSNVGDYPLLPLHCCAVHHMQDFLHGPQILCQNKLTCENRVTYEIAQAWPRRLMIYILTGWPGTAGIQAVNNEYFNCIVPYHKLERANSLPKGIAFKATLISVAFFFCI